MCDEGHRVLVHGGFLDCAPEVEPVVERTAASFGFEWTTFDEPRPGDEVDWKLYFADVSLTEISGLLALDAGCGMGRYSRITARHVRALVALDLSDAVTAAAGTLRGAGNVTVVRADLRRPPLEPASFGLVSSLGVLHHLPDPEEGFRSLVRLLAPDGLLLLYLYSRETHWSLRRVMLGAATAMRRVTVRMNHRLLRAVSVPVAAVLYGTFVQPGRIVNRLPMAYYRRRPFRDLWLDTFDRLSAPVEYRYAWADIEPWYIAANLEVLAVREDTGLFVLARAQHGILRDSAANE